MTPVKSTLRFLIKAYQYCLSPWLGNQCRFYPSCSNYCLQSIEKHGALKGCYLGMLRILRCNPFFKGGYDPVPEQSSDLNSTSKRLDK